MKRIPKRTLASRCGALGYTIIFGFGAAAAADEPPDITVHPQSLALIASEDAQFSVTATGTEPLAYQWRLNHENIGGATATNYPISNAQSYNAGDYEVVVTNAAGAVTSTVATLTVHYPRALVEPEAGWVSIGEGGVGGEVQFSVGPLPHAPLGYQWRFNGADIKWATDSNLVVGIQSVANAGNYSVWVKTSAGGVEGPATTLEVLTVNAVREQWRTNAVTTGNTWKMVSDEAGNLYFAGGLKIVKLDKAGQVLWTSGFSGEVSDLVLDSEGNIYAVGWNLTVKYNAAGSNCWSVSYSGVARGVAVDGAGNVYVTGGSTGTNTIYPYDFATVKYDRDGNQVWLRRYDSGGHDAGYGIALDSETNVIVTGESLTIKYDRDGNRLWLTPGSGHKVVVDPDDNVFVSDLDRDSSGNGNGPLHLMMLSKTNGQILSYESLGNTVLLNLLADLQGNVFVIGTSYSGGWNGEWNYVVHRRGAGGSNEWNDSYPGLGYAGTVDKRGNVYVTGSRGPGTCRIVKWTTDGQRAWVLDPPGFSTGLGVTVDNEFNISVANDLGTVINYDQKHRLHTLGFQPNGNFRLTLTGEPRVPVWLRASTNLWDWQNLSTLQFSVATADFTDMQAPAFAHRFYHTLTVAPPAP